MNKVFKIVWNQALQSWVVVSEFAKSRGKSSTTTVGSVAVAALIATSPAVADEAYFHVEINDSKAKELTTAGKGSLVAGEKAVASGTNAVVIGHNAKSNSNTTVAVGYMANASNTNALAVGNQANATGQHTVAVGVKANATADNVVAVGNNASASATNSLAVGIKSNVSSENSIAIGNGANITRANGEFKVMSGGEEVTLKAYQQSSNSIAMGTNATVTGQKSVAIGFEANVTGKAANEASGVAIGDKATVEAKNSVAIGHWAEAKAGGEGSAMALGDQAGALNTYALAMGTRATATADHSTAIAKNSHAYSKYSVAIGVDAITGELGKPIEEKEAQTDEEKKVRTIFDNKNGTVTIQDGKKVITYKPDSTKGYGETAIGKNTLATGTRSTAIGVESQATGNYSTAIANRANATALRSTAIGNLANATSGYALAVGDSTNATGSHSIAIGSSTTASGQNGGAIGKSANSTGISSFAIGTNSTASANQALAIGTESRGYSTDGMAMGRNAQAGEENSTVWRAIAIGNSTKALANDSIAMGTNATVTNTSIAAIAIGRDTVNSGNSTVAIGDKINVSADRAIGIGREIENVTRADNVVIGSRSSENSATISESSYDSNGLIKEQINSATVGAVNYGGFAGSRSASVFSIGRDKADHENGDYGDAERRLINVAAGEISARSTDAINGSQLYAVANSIPFTYTDKDGNPLTKIGNKFYTPGNYVVAPDGNAYPAGSVIDKDGNVYVAGTALTSDGNPPTGARKATVVTAKPNSDIIVSIISPNVDANTGKQTINTPTKLANVADGDISPTSKEAVNGSQLYALAGNNNYNSTYTVTNPDGTKTTHKNVVTDENGQALMKTYNVYGGGNYLTNSAAEAINKMNEGGIKFFHVNDGSNKFADQDFNEQDSRAKGTFSTAIGYQTQANGTASVAMGNISEAKGEQSIAIGDKAKANGKQSIAIGTGNVVSGNHSGAIGDPTVVTGDSAYSIGNNNTIVTDNTYALGSDIKATSENSVFLGDKSASFEQAGSTKAAKTGAHVARGTTESAYTYRAENDANVAGKNAVGVVSVGNANESRQIQGVAAGVVSATSTDAINGSQLYYTNKAIQNNLDSKINKLGDVVNKNNRQLRAGIAGTNAAVSLPQVYMPGKSMVAASAGTFKGEGALAVGYSRASDNGKVILKLQGNANTRGDIGGGVGVGYQW